MQQRDTWVGAGLLIVALAIIWHVRSFPESPGQPYNAALFPGLAAGGLAIAAIVLIARGWRRVRLSARPDDGTEHTRTPGKSEAPSRLFAILLTAGAIVFYLLAANTLGFVLTGFVVLAALMWAYGVKARIWLPVAAIATLVIHTSFYKLLKVPLPWGLLQPIAW